MMRGIDYQQGDMFSYLLPEQRVRKDHPLRAVRAMTDEILERMSPLFDAMYAEGGRPSIAPEKLLRAQLLQNAVFGPVGAAADGVDRVQHSAPLVCGAEPG
jgi:transposase